MVKTFCVLLVALLVAGLAFAQIKLAAPGERKVQPSPAFTNAIILGTNLSPNPEFPKLSTLPSADPGVYVTRPYSLMIKVPDAHHDDIMMFPHDQIEPRLRVIKPELQMDPKSPGSSIHSSTNLVK